MGQSVDAVGERDLEPVGVADQVGKRRKQRRERERKIERERVKVRGDRGSNSTAPTKRGTYHSLNNK